MNIGTKNLNKKEQKKIVNKTHTGSLTKTIGFMGESFVNKKSMGGGVILRSDEKYHDESLNILEKQNIYPL